jgi:DNA-binding response OmpR family regulator
MIRDVQQTVLVVEDDDGIALPLVRTLDREGYAVERVAEGLPAVERVGAGGVQLVILDLGLPDIDGLEVCHRVRAGGYDDGIIILTARGEELDRVVGLDVGADDYLPKPFALSELLARSRALLRRSVRMAAVRPHTDPTAPPGAEPAVEATPAQGTEHLRVDARSRRAWVDGEELTLSSKEFDLLALLFSEDGAVLTRETLMDKVWDENWYGSTKTLDVTIGRLRQKLEASGARARVVAVRGVGFRLEGADA